ncbi:MAG: hybrid sensor histidine kinase/response regulator transcription factor [Mucilaginibacter sp.]
MIQDRSGVIWIGLDGGGVCKINSSGHGFKNITHSISPSNNLLNTHIRSVFQDSKGGLWLGTKGSGLFYSKNRVYFGHQQPLTSGSVNVFFENNQKDLWVGSSDGLYIYQNFYNKPPPPLQVVNNFYDTSSLSGPQVTAIVKDQDQTIWVGTQEHGLNKLLAATNGKFRFKRYKAKIGSKGALQNERISCLLVDFKNRLWVGTYGGLYLYNRDKDDFFLFRGEVNGKNTLSNNTIISLAQDHKGNIWIGTEQGLNELIYNDLHHYTFKRYFESAGFPNDYVHAIQVDRFDDIWMSTNSGITKLKTKTQTFLNFNNENGVSFNTFAQNSSFLARDGEIFFGGPSGLTYFYPDSIFLDKFKPNVFITDLKVNNTDVAVGQIIKGNKILSKSLFVTNKITLSYKEDIFSLTFASLDYHASNRNQYEYKLQGFNDSWINAGKSRTVTYTNLSPGTYIFEVRGTNSDQIWNAKSVSLEINILPPPWKTWWAYTLYSLIIVFSLWLSRHIKLRRLNLENKLQLADLNYKKEHEITVFKSKLFSNISHEFRTPLSLIIGPIEGLIESEKLDSSVSKVLYNVQSQSKRLLSLVNQFLDFNKAESNALKLNAVKQDIVPVFKSICYSFAYEADRKKIKFLFEANKEQIFLEIDKDKIESIIYNLLSNAFKFTPNGGEINFKVLLNEKESICEFLILDSGRGISAQDKVKVFDRFYQASQAEPGQYAGTGIGLAFVKDLVELHKGTIDVEDNTPSGTVFKIILPATDSRKNGQLDQLITYEGMAVENNLDDTNENKDLPIILIVEDSEELNYYISEILKPIGHVISTFNGKEGLAQSLNTLPDLIVTDIMMPELNGYQLSAAIKSDIRTSHIPIILLTAKSDEPSYIEGLKLGADMYLTKPFSPRILISHVKNLIQSRKLLKLLFAQQLRIEPNEIGVISFEEEFIKKLIDYIEEHISEDELSIDKMADHVFMSRSTLYRKLKALTGMSISDFIRLIKLKRSAQFLATGKYTVNMAAFEAGFNDLKYFRKVFQNQFGINPSEYLKREKSKSKTI